MNRQPSGNNHFQGIEPDYINRHEPGMNEFTDLGASQGAERKRWQPPSRQDNPYGNLAYERPPTEQRSQRPQQQQQPQRPPSGQSAARMSREESRRELKRNQNN